MNFFRLLLLAAAVYLITRLLRARLRPPPAPPPGRGEKPSVPYEPMARCTQCGVHTPQTSLSPAGLCQHCQP